MSASHNNSDDAAPSPRMSHPNPRDGDNGARDDLAADDEDARRRDLAALNEQYPPTGSARRANPRRTYTDPGYDRHTTRRSSESFLRVASPRRHADATDGVPRSPRFDNHELQPIPSRAVLAKIEAMDASSDVVDKTSNMDRTAVVKKRGLFSRGLASGEKPSIRDEIRAYIRKQKALKQRRKMGPQNWRVRLGDRVKALHQKIIIETILRRKPLPPSKDGRHIPLDVSGMLPGGLIDERRGKPYIGNFIRSSRYTVYDFLPKQLIFQFSKLGNFYFLVMGILQMIPGLSTVGRWTTIAPLGVFVAFSMAKEGYDDYRRYRLDKGENRSQTWVLADQAREKETKHAQKQADKKKEKEAEEGREVMPGHLQRASMTGTHAGGWVPVQWQHVRVGDVIRIRRDEAIPADIALLHATGPNGIAYIDTMALDGETNLKSKQACPPLVERCNTLDGIRRTKATIVSEDPNLDLYNYDGRVNVDGETLPLSLNNVVYRGSTLRNTTEAIGLVINSGEECKIRMNANKNVRAKKPAMQSTINMMILIQIFIVCMLAMGLTIGYYLWRNPTVENQFYDTVPFREIFVGYLIMFNTLIPLSLYISLEIVKLGQLLLLQDAEMYDPLSNTPMVANTTTILENLGQVSYVFSDKTGTLTENLMRFRKLTVAGVACLHDMDIQRDEEIKLKKLEALEKKKKGKAKEPLSTKPLESTQDGSGQDDALHERPVPIRASSTTSMSKWRSSVRPNAEPEMKTEELLDYIRKRPNTTFSRKAKHFLLCIALCHTCLPEKKDNGDIEFQAASPDELALVEAARDLGLMLIDRPTQSIVLESKDVDGNLQSETYQVLDVIEFSSKRKRMSIIIRMPDGRICVFCKGADNVIMARLKLSHLAEQKARDVNQRASLRRTFEQDKAIRRMSAQAASAHNSPRNSVSVKRGEGSSRVEGLRLSIGRRSTELNRLSAQFPASPRSPRVSTDLLSPRQSLGRVPSFDDFDRRFDESLAANEGAVFEKCFQHVDEFATEGLRTLLYAYRYIDEDAYSQWKQIYKEAETSLVDRQERIEEAGEIIEQKFELAGATAIEDKLQEGVPDTIDKLRRANIKVWMLTGDKRETAINIGHSARVCKPYSQVYILDSTQGNLQDSLTVTLNDVCRGMVPHSVLVIDGQTLSIIDSDEDLAMLFYDLVVRVDSVICCRASPAQKANLVMSIRRYIPKSMTLAIGDGANDIGMIQASHVGIGISGREGLQAARISDYSIAQFRFLQKLLFVHGRWNYLRTGKYVLATFWKEILFFIVQAHFQRLNGYTGTSLYESWSLTVFNSLFTSLPVILLGIFEKDLRAETLLAVPELYTFGQKGRGFSYLQYLGWMVMGVTGSFVIFYFMWAVYNSALFTEDTSMYAMGMLCFSVGVIFINIKLL